MGKVKLTYPYHICFCFLCLIRFIFVMTERCDGVFVAVKEALQSDRVTDFHFASYLIFTIQKLVYFHF